jgi:hypothetical protein
MEEVIEYKVVTGDKTDLLSKVVNDAIAEGFQPFGGIAIAQLQDRIWYSQAMVKYVKPS